MVTLDFKGLLHHYRKRVKMTQRKLAQQIPCDNTLISMIEGGKRFPTRDYIEAFLDIPDLYLTAEEQQAIRDAYARERRTFATESCNQRPRQPAAASPSQPPAFPMPATDSAYIPFLAPPRPPYYLVGRDPLLRTLKQQLLAPDSLGVYALNGLPGVGKTALAIELAYDNDIRAHFCDGVLWVGLGREPNVLMHLSHWGLVLGIAQVEIDKRVSVTARAAVLHTIISMRRMLLIIDDAWEEEETLAFQVGGPNCAHLLTTRLPHVARSFAGAGSTHLRELSPPDGLTLLEQQVPNITTTEPEAARRLVHVVGGLPLALNLIGHYLKKEAQPPRRLRAALQELEQAEKYLQLPKPQSPFTAYPDLPVDTPLSLQAVISISDAALPPEAQSALRALAVFPPKPNTFSEAAALTVAATTTTALDTLMDYGLLETRGTTRYTLHQSIAAYALTHLADEQVYVRLVNYFVSYLENREYDYLNIAPEINNITHVLQLALKRSMREALVKGTLAAYNYLEMRGLYTIANKFLGYAQATAETLNDRPSQVILLRNLGELSIRQGHFEQAVTYLQRAIPLAEELKDDKNLCLLMGNIGVSSGNRGEYDRAKQLFNEALTLAYRIEDDHRILCLRVNLGVVARNVGQYNAAAAHFSAALRLAYQIQHPERIATILENLGEVYERQGKYELAEQQLRAALEMARQWGGRERLIGILTSWAIVQRDYGDTAGARAHLHEALEMARQIGHRERMSVIHRELGSLAGEQQAYLPAEQHFRTGLQLAYAIDHRKNISSLLLAHGQMLWLQGHAALLADELHTELRIFEQSEDKLRAGLDIATTIGQHWLICQSNLALGDLWLSQQKYDPAREAFNSVLASAQARPLPAPAAAAHFGLARLAAQQGNLTPAQSHGQASLTMYTQLNHHQVKAVTHWLANLKPG